MAPATRVLLAVVALAGGCTRRELGFRGAAPWPMVGHDAQHRGASPFVGPSAPVIAFDLVSGDDGFVGDPVIDAAGFAYVALAAGNTAARLYSIDPSRPNELTRWSIAPCDFPDVRASIGPDGNVYATCAGLLDASELVSVTPDGEVRWTVASSVSDATAPVVAPDGTIYVGSAGIAAYSTAGALLWQTGEDDVPAPPALGDDGVVYFADVSGQVHAVASSGAESWVTAVDGAPPGGGCGVTMGQDDELYACFPDGLLASLGTDGTPRWTHKLADGFAWPAAVGPDGTVYIVSIDALGASSQATLHAFASEGTEKWATLLDGTGGSAPTLDAAGNIYVGDDRALAAFAADGTQRWSTPLSGRATSLAVAANGQLLVGSSDGAVHAFGP